MSGEVVSNQKALVDREAYLKRQIKATKRIERVGHYSWMIGVSYAVMLLAGLLEPIIEQGISLFRYTTIILLFVFPIPLIVLGFPVSRHYAGKLRQLQNEYYEIYALNRSAEKNLKPA